MRLKSYAFLYVFVAALAGCTQKPQMAIALTQAPVCKMPSFDQKPESASGITQCGEKFNHE